MFSILIKASILTMLLSGLSGCVTATPIIGPDGTKNILIECDDIKDCYSKALEVCKGNYSIVNTSTETGGSSGVVSTVTSLLVKCDSN